MTKFTKLFHQKMNFKKIVFLFFVLQSCIYVKPLFTFEKEQDSSVYEASNIYTYFVVDANADVKLIKGDSTTQVKIFSNKNFNYFEFIPLNDTTLLISDKTPFNNLKFRYNKKLIEITSKNFKRVDIYGVSKVFSTDTLNLQRFLIRFYTKISFSELKINCSDHLFFEVWGGTGNFNVCGTTTYLTILNHGQAYIYAQNLKADYCFIEHRSTGDCYINVKNFIVAKLCDVGNVYYCGDPQINSIFLNKGRIFKIK